LIMPAICPFLLLPGKAEDAARFYVAIFPNAQIEKTIHHGPGSFGPVGSVLSVTFSLSGQRYIALNGGPPAEMTVAISFHIDCKDQAEVDHYWTALTADGGAPGQCGWLRDRFGLHWQVIPSRLPELLWDADPARAGRAMAAMMQMGKIDIATLEAAANG
jgi:predicted 3-demethylubiquinone-9 3-methyltransferase (glyoxalase superfamily)